MLTSASVVLRLGIVVLTAALAQSCVRSYRGAPPLRFADYVYASPEGQPWPVKRLALPGVAGRYGLATAPEVAYVELNPTGAQSVLFLHGLGSYLKFWRYQLDAFAQAGYRVVALDLPGYGKSDKPAAFPYTTESFAEVARELSGLLALGRPIVVGHSMGGQTALSWAIQYPGEPRALVLAAPAGFEFFSHAEQEWFRKNVSTAGIRGASESALWGSVRYANFMRWRPELEWLIEERVRVANTPEFAAYAYANVRTIDGLAQNTFVRENLHRVAVPTLIVFGTGDRLIPNPFMHGGFTSDIMRYGHERIAGSVVRAFDRCGHSVQLDCPQDFNREALSFVSGLPTGS